MLLLGELDVFEVRLARRFDLLDRRLHVLAREREVLFPGRVDVGQHRAEQAHDERLRIGLPHAVVEVRVDADVPGLAGIVGREVVRPDVHHDELRRPRLEVPETLGPIGERALVVVGHLPDGLARPGDGDVLGIERARSDGAVGRVLVLLGGVEGAHGARPLVAVAGGDRVPDELHAPLRGRRRRKKRALRVEPEERHLADLRLRPLVDRDVVYAFGEALGERVDLLRVIRLDDRLRLAIHDHLEQVPSVVLQAHADAGALEAAGDRAARPGEADRGRVGHVEATNQLHGRRGSGRRRRLGHDRRAERRHHGRGRGCARRLLSRASGDREKRESHDERAAHDRSHMPIVAVQTRPSEIAVADRVTFTDCGQ